MTSAILAAMRRSLALLALVASGLTACGSSSSNDTAGTTAPTAPATAAAGVRLARVASFDQPLYVTAPPGDRRRIFVVEQTGRIRVVRDGRKLPTPFLDLRNQVSCCGERGLFSMAFPPDYATSRRFYVDYTDRNGDTRVVEFRRSGSRDRAVKASARLVLFQRQPEPNHNGGLVIFGPDGHMYIGLGDGGGADDRHGARGNGQNLGTLLGKILRIDPRASGSRAYTVPRDNPFVGRGGARSEIYAYGLRNPWRFSFDRATGDMAIADVGQNQVEEIDFARRGGARGVNYGWRVWEGRRRNYSGESAPGAVFPVLTYGHGGGGCSITGGYVVRDPGLSALRGQYVYGDLCIGRLRAVRLGPGSARGDHALGMHVSQLSSFGEDARGQVYATSLDGPVYRLAPR
jgi:glucose/arabinose dehydrogenase